MSGLILPGAPLIPDNDEAEIFVLELAKREKITIGIGMGFQSSSQNLAFERAIEVGWLRLIDIRPVSMRPNTPPTTTGRVFMLTGTGDARLNELLNRKQIDASIAKQ